MSRSWTERLRISLAPERVALVRTGSVFRRRPAYRTSVDCASGTQERPWQAAIEALRSLLGTERGRATIVLSNALVRYALVPDNVSVSGEREEQALARFHFSRIHGDRAKDWDVRVSQPHGGVRLASAADRELLAAIRESFAGARAKLVSIQPYLMAAFNAARPRLARTSAWLVLVEERRLCLALATSAGWASVHSQRLSTTEDNVAELLERQALRVPGAGTREALVHGIGLEIAPGWKLTQLAEGPYAMALAA